MCACKQVVFHSVHVLTNFAVHNSVDDCRKCRAGTFCPFNALEETACGPGTFSRIQGMEECLACPGGTYQDRPRSTGCKDCEEGSYCPPKATRALPCPSGSYSDANNLSSSSGCMSCLLGSFCTAGSTQPTPCAAGSFSNTTGKAVCEPCAAGTFQGGTEETGCDPCEAGKYASGGAMACTECAEGKFADNLGSAKCSHCPFPLSSSPGSTNCPMCLEEFYLVDSSAAETDMFLKPRDYCKACPLHAECPQNSSLETFKVPPGFWRASIYTSRLYECYQDSAGLSTCTGSQPSQADSRRSQDLEDGDYSGIYCIEGNRGPRCAVCISSSQYFDPATAHCEDCAVSNRLSYVCGIAGIIFLLFVLYRMAVWKFEAVGRLARRLAVNSSNIGAGVKFKELISFYQVFNALGAVYGVKLHSGFRGWFSFLTFFDFELVDIVVPGKCLGSMSKRITVNALVPFVITFCVSFCILLAHMMRRSDTVATTKMPEKGVTALGRCLQAAIFISYLMLPSVLRNTFLSRQCESFGYNDATDESRSYLVADLDIRCSAHDSEFEKLSILFWVFFVLWSVLVPLVYLVLILRIRRTVVEKHSSHLANACKFLWVDYNPSFFFWDVIDVMRKLVLSALILFVDTEQGSSRVLRLVLASIISTMYSCILAVARPFKRSDDMHIACLANLFLALTFISGKSAPLFTNAALGIIGMPCTE